MTTFGIDLKSHGEEIPYIVVKCISEIDKRGKSVKGLYRVSSVKSKVDSLCQCFENNAESIDISDIHPNVIANVLKLYFRQLPEPLLTFKLYPDFIKIAKEYSANSKIIEQNMEVAEKMLNALREVVRKLPSIFLLTLSYLCHHLKRIADVKDVNNMPAYNLGIVFGPTLLRTQEGSASFNSLVDTVYQTRVVELLITYANEVFGPPPKVQGKDDSFEEKETLEDEVSQKSKDDNNDTLNDVSSVQNFNHGGKVLDLSQTQEPISSSPYSSSVIKLSGQQVITSNHPDNTLSSANSGRPSVQELRRQFFVTSPNLSQFRSASSLNPNQEQLSPLSSVANSTLTVSQHTKIKRPIATTNSLTTMTTSQSSGSLKLIGSRDDREPKYV